MAEAKKTESTQDTKTSGSQPVENNPGGVTDAQAKKAQAQGSATGVAGVRGEEGGQQTYVPGELPTTTLDESDRTDSDRAVNPNPNVGAVLNPPINPTKDEDVDKPVYIPPPGSQNRELRRNVEKHAESLMSVFDTEDDKKK